MSRIEKNKQNKKKGKALKIILIILLFIIVIIAAVFAGGYWYVNDKLGKMQQVEIKDEDLNIDEKVEENLTGYRNIAIFGVDSRSSNISFMKEAKSPNILVNIAGKIIRLFKH